MGKATNDPFMDETDRLKNKVSKTIGEYVFDFELMLDYIRSIIKAIAQYRGLENLRLIDILLHDSTGQPILTYFKGFYIEEYDFSINSKPKVEKFMHQLFKDIEQSIKDRNNIVHSTYAFGYLHDSDNILMPYVDARKQKVFAEGLKDIYEKSGLDISTIENKNKKLIELQQKLLIILMNIHNKNKYILKPYQKHEVGKLYEFFCKLMNYEENDEYEFNFDEAKKFNNTWKDTDDLPF